MNKKFLALFMAFLMLFGTLAVMVPSANAVITPLTLSATTGGAGSTWTITAGAGATSVGRDVFVVFNKEVADADLGAQYQTFAAPTAATAYGYVALGTWTSYAPGDPIYLDLAAPDPGAGVVSVGDTRLTPVTHVNLAGTATAYYAAGSVVAAGDFDITAIPTVLFAMPGNMFWTNHVTTPAHTVFNWAAGDGLYIREASNGGLTPAPGLVGAGDLRARYPSVSVTIPGTGITSTYAAWTKVKSPVINWYKGIYNDADANNVVSAGDTRRTEVVVSQLRYAAGTTVAATNLDNAGVPLAFSQAALTYDCFADVNNDGVWQPGEPIYMLTKAAPFPGFVAAGDIRNSYVSGTSAAGVQFQYLPFTTVVAGDLDIGTAVRFFPLTQRYVSELAVAAGHYTYGEWIYFTAGVWPGTVAGTTRSSPVDWTDKSVANNVAGVLALTFPAAELWGADWSNTVGYASTTVVAAGDADVGRPLSAFAATDKRRGLAGAAYVDTMPVYRDVDGDNFVSIGDVRESLIYTAAARPYGVYPVNNPIPPGGQLYDYYHIGSTVAAGDTDLVVPGLGLSNFLPTEKYYDPSSDGAYLGGDIVAYAGSNNLGNVMPFPVTFGAAPAAVSFTVPTNTPLGNHAVFLITDQPPNAALAAPYATAGLLSTQLTGAGGVKVPTSPLPWFITGATGWAPTAAVGATAWGTQAGFAVFAVNVPVIVFLHPGIADPYKPGWSHTLDTYYGTQGGAAQQNELFNHYLDYAILASSSASIGDFQFDITVLANIHRIEIYVPPDFKWPNKQTPATTGAMQESIWTDITNDYAYIQTSTRPAGDNIAPGWVRIRIGQNEYLGGDMTIVPGTYHIRLFNMQAPTVAGLYFFKIYINSLDIGVGNYPITIVKAELNPAWIEVTVRTDLRFAPPFVSGSVNATGTTPDGRAVSAIAYWGPLDFLLDSFTPGQTGAEYHMWIFGLAAGTYTLTAQASGFNPTTTDRITLDPGQSYHTFIVVYWSPFVTITVWSKHGTGAIPWGNLWQLPFGTNNPYAAPNNAGPRRDMNINLYDSSNNLVAFWASDWNYGFADKVVPLSNRLLGLHDDGACIPTSTSYHAVLVDNWDLLGNVRGYPSTHWDGHVPWATADYIGGWPQGQYTVESYVTGYIMDQSDAYQRSFSVVGLAVALQYDLRRSNWIEVTMHMPNGVALSVPTTVVLTAVDSAGMERADVAFLAGPGTPWPVGLNIGPIVIEGWNAVNPGEAAFKNDYGLNPTASSHSAGAVTLAGNPYTIKLYMADMGIPSKGIVGSGWYNVVGPDPMVSVFLCNSAQSLSFDIQNAWLWISLRSVDFEVPAHSRPWTFPGSEIWVYFISNGTIVDTLDPTYYGLIQDPGRTTTNGLPAPFTIGWPIAGAPAASYGVTPFDIDSVGAAGTHEHIGVRYTGTDPTGFGQALNPFWGNDFWNAVSGDLRPTRLPAGEYTFFAATHGYIMRNAPPVQVAAGDQSDIEADVIQGGQIRVTVDFKHEGQATAFNGFIRVEVFDANNVLVGASIYGQADPNVNTAIGTPGGAYIPYDPTMDWFAYMAAANGNHPGPAQATDLGWPTAIFPSSDAGFWTAAMIAAHGGALLSPALGTPFATGQRAALSSQLFFYGAPALVAPATTATWASWQATNPADANRLMAPPGALVSFDVYGFYWYHGDYARTWAGGWPTVTWGGTSPRGLPYTVGYGDRWDYGLKGSTDIPGWPGSGGGLYSVKVWAFDPRGPDNAYEAAPPTDDWRMYAMDYDLTNIAVPWGGAQQLYVHMDDMATLRGTVSWVDMFGNVHPLAWAQIDATNPETTAYSSGNGGIGPGSSDPSGAYIMWLTPGSHDVSVSTSEAPQVWTSAAPTQNQAFTVVVSNGWVGGGDTRLSGSGTAVPEVPAFMAPLALIAVLAASVWLLRRRTVNIPVMIK